MLRDGMIMRLKPLVILSMLAFLGGCGAEQTIKEFEDIAVVSYFVDGTRLVIQAGHLFEEDRKTLKPEAISVLRALYHQVEQEYFTHISITAHCDDAITEHSARDVTHYQAEVISGYFWFRGVDVSEVDFEGKGFQEPIADMNTPAGIAANQRIEIRLT